MKKRKNLRFIFERREAIAFLSKSSRGSFELYDMIDYTKKLK